MADVQLKIGDVVKMKYHTGEAVPKFVVSAVSDDYVDVTWFNEELNSFSTQRLLAAVFKKV